MASCAWSSRWRRVSSLVWVNSPSLERKWPTQTACRNRNHDREVKTRENALPAGATGRENGNVPSQHVFSASGLHKRALLGDLAYGACVSFVHALFEAV